MGVLEDTVRPNTLGNGTEIWREDCVMLRVGETRFASAPRSHVRSLDGMNGFAASCAHAQ
jgi:hypothetical protein